MKEKTNVILVPKKAIERQNGKVFVLVWQNKGIVKQEVELGVFDGNNWEVLSGVTEKEELAIRR